MKLPEFLTEVKYGEIVITGHRIGLLHIVQDYRDGFSAEDLHREFPTLPLELLEKVLAFSKENQAEVDAYVARCEAEIEHQRATTPRQINWDELRRRMEEMGRLEKP
jgi:uncharacterized protein (DUF433 family)